MESASQYHMAAFNMTFSETVIFAIQDLFYKTHIAWKPIPVLQLTLMITVWLVFKNICYGDIIAWFGTFLIASIKLMKFAMPASKDTSFSMVNVPLATLDALFTILMGVAYIAFLDLYYKAFIVLKPIPALHLI